VILKKHFCDANCDAVSLKLLLSRRKFFTCKPFSILKVLHVRNKIQHKGAKSGEEAKVA
jgi:hypothetical protein